MIDKLIDDGLLNVKLVSEVLNKDNELIEKGIRSFISYSENGVFENRIDDITIYKFVFVDCKEWALSEGFELDSKFSLSSKKWIM